MKVTSNVKYIPAGVTQYIVDGNDGEINVDTSVSAVTIILPNIINSGYTNTDKGFIINDFSGNAGTNNITLVASNNTVNSQSSVLISVNGGTAKCSIASMNEWFVITEPSTSGMSGTLTANYIPKAASSSTLTNSIIYQDGHNIAIGTTTAVAKLHVLQNTVGTGAKAFSVNFATIGETFYLDDNGYAYYYGGGFTVAGSNAILNLVSNGGVSPSIKFKYNNGASTSGFLYGVGASMFFETPAFGLGTTYFNPQARLHIKGIDSTSANYSLKVDNSASTNLLSIANNGVAIFNSILDGSGGGVDNYKYSSTTGGVQVSYNSFSGASIANYSTNGSIGTAINEVSGFYQIASTNRISLKTKSDGKTHLYMGSDGQIGIGGDFFTTSASLHVQGIDSTSSNYALKVDNSASSPLLYVRNDGNVYSHGVGSIVTNTAFGLNSLLSNLTGSDNTVYGVNAMRVNTTGTNNTAVGVNALYNSNGSFNTATGYISLESNTGDRNTAFGYGSLSVNTTGIRNTAVGMFAGNVNSVGDDNVFIGYNANALSNNLTNAIAIGYNATVSSSNSMVLGEGVNVGIGIPSPAAKLHIKGADATSSNYALKVDNSATTPLIYVRNDGATFFNNSAYINNSASAFQSLLIGDYLGTLNNNLNIVAGISTPGSNIVRVSYYGNTQWLSAFSIQNSGAAFGNLLVMPDGGNVGFGTLSPTATAHIKGVDATSSNYALKVDNSASSPLLYVRNDGLLSAPSMPTSNAGLTTGDMYVDTAANILANGDKVVGWKV